MIKASGIICMLVLIFYPVGIAISDNHKPDQGNEKRERVWADFHKLRYEKFGKFQEIDIYAENDSLSRICYISDGQIFVYYHKDQNNNGMSHIEPNIHAKLLPHKINRITFAKSEKDSFGFFQLWYYEKLELSIGAGG